MLDRKINYEPLSQAVSFMDARTYALQGRRKKLSWWRIVSRIVAALILLPIVVSSVRRIADADTILIWVAVIITAVVTWQLYRYIKNYKHVKLTRFAEANNLQYTQHFAGSPHDGLIFNVGRSQAATEILADYHETYGFEMANFSYETGSGRNRRTRNYHYIMLKLPRRVPHMVLDAKGNNFLGVSSLPTSFCKSQRLQLEGDFNKYFTLYCPKEYERDALYIFTPDVMAMMMDLGAKYDVEIIDDKLFLYGKGRKHRLNRAYFEKAFHILTVFGKKMHARVDYYADERVGDRSVNAIDTAGYRLRRSYIPTIISVISTVLFIGFFLWLMFG